MALSNAERQAAHRARLKARLSEKPAINAPAPALANVPATRRWNAIRDHAEQSLRQMAEEMQAYYDERSQEWQEGERGQDMSNQLETVESILNDLDSLKA